jgi:hypothetical protein
MDTEDSYNHYMMCRWLSMHSPRVATLINDTANWLYPVFDTKQDSYKLLHSIIPFQQFKKIHYIKKKKKDRQESHDNITATIAKNMEISKREVNSYVKTLNLDLSKYTNNYE